MSKEDTWPVWALVHGAANACHASTINPSAKDPSYWQSGWRQQCKESCGGWQIIRFGDVPKSIAEKAQEGAYDTHEEYDVLKKHCEEFEIVHEEGDIAPR